MSFSAEPKVTALQGKTQAADPVPHPHGPKLAPRLSQEGRRQLWFSGITARRDRDIGTRMGLWGDGGGAAIRFHTLGLLLRGAAPQTLGTQMSPFLEQCGGGSVTCREQQPSEGSWGLAESSTQQNLVGHGERCRSETLKGKHLPVLFRGAASSMRAR